MSKLKSLFGLGGGKKKKMEASSVHGCSFSTSSGSSSSGAMGSWAEEELKRVFRKFDANGDGKISAEELGTVMAALGHPAVSKEALLAMVAEVDTDGDGFIDLNDFLVLNTRGLEREGATADLVQAFQVFDVDGDGKITAEKVQRVLRSLREEVSLAECQRMVRSVDGDDDGAVSLEEFMAMMQAGGPDSVLHRADGC